MFRVLIRVVIILLGFSTLLNGRLYGNHELVADVLLNHMENHARLKGFRKLSDPMKIMRSLMD